LCALENLASLPAHEAGQYNARWGTISVFNGLTPSIKTFADSKAEAEAVAAWIKD
jgi:hypothetical protein